MKKKYQIAGLTVAMESFGTTKKQAIPYLCESNQIEDITISSDKDILIAKYSKISEDVAEYLATGSNFYLQLLNYDGFMLHSSTVVVDGKAYLFTAYSGTGKSTHTRLWLEYFGERAYILNDDKPALRMIAGKWYAFGTPWSGKVDLSVNECVEIAGIAVLERSEENEITRYYGKNAILDIFRQVNRPKAMECRVKLLDLLDNLITNVPIWKLKCNMEPEAVLVSYEAMSGKKVEEI